MRLGLAQKLSDWPLHDYQKEIFTREPRKRLIVKSRRAGISTMVALEALVDCIRNSGFQVLLLSKDEDQSKLLLQKVKGFLIKIPDWQEAVGDTNNKTELSFRNGSIIRSLPCTPHNARGYEANHLVMDEFGVMPFVEEIWVGARPTIATGGRVTIFSSPKGKLNKFYDLWINGEGWEKLEIPWDKCPHLKEEDLGKEDMTPGEFEQEYCCSFEEYTGALFTWPQLESLVTNEFPKAGLTVMGYDPAQVHDRSAVILVRLKEGKKTILPLADLKDTPYLMQAKRIIQFAEDFAVSKVIYDKGGQLGVTIQENLSPLGSKVLGSTFSGKFKVEMLINIKNEIQKGNVKIFKTDYTDLLLKDLFSFDINRPNFIQYKKDGHQDFLAALMLAWSEIKRQRGIRAIDFQRGYWGSSSLGPVGHPIF